MFYMFGLLGQDVAIYVILKQLVNSEKKRAKLIIDGINMLAWSCNLSRFVGLTSKYVSNAKNFNKLKLTPQLQYIVNTLRSQTVFGFPMLHEILYQMTGIPLLSSKEMGDEL